MKLVLTTTLVLSMMMLLPATVLAADPLGNCAYSDTSSGESIRCTDDSGHTTLYVAHGPCTTGTYVWYQGAWVWVRCL